MQFFLTAFHSNSFISFMAKFVLKPAPLCICILWIYIWHTSPQFASSSPLGQDAAFVRVNKSQLSSTCNNRNIIPLIWVLLNYIYPININCFQVKYFFINRFFFSYFFQLLLFLDLEFIISLPKIAYCTDSS